MGLLDRLGGGSRPTSLEPRAAFLLAAISMVGIDGDIDDDEIAVIHRLDGTGRTEAWDSAVNVWKTHSVEDCIALIAASMNSDQQLVTWTNLADLAMADGVLAGAEEQLLEAYVAAFDLDTSDLERVVSVIGLKNDRSVFEQ